MSRWLAIAVLSGASCLLAVCACASHAAGRAVPDSLLERTRGGPILYGCALKSPTQGSAACNACQYVGEYYITLPDPPYYTSISIYAKCDQAQYHDLCRHMPWQGSPTPTCTKGSVSCTGTRLCSENGACSGGDLCSNYAFSTECSALNQYRTQATDGWQYGVDCSHEGYYDF